MNRANVLFVLAACFVVAASLHAQTYLFVNIDPPLNSGAAPPHPYTEIWGINGASDLVGNCVKLGSDSGCFDGNGHGWTLHGGQYGIADANTSFCDDTARTINLSHQIGGGYMTTGCPAASPNAFFAATIGFTQASDGSGFTSFQYAANGVTYGTAVFGMNDTGAMVGQYVDPATFLQHGLKISVDPGTNQPVLEPYDVQGALQTSLKSINSAGDFVGRFVDQNKAAHGFLQRANEPLVQIDFNNDPASNTVTQGINGLGQIVGRFGPNSASHGMLLPNGAGGATVDLHPQIAAQLHAANGSFNSINDLGQIAGYYADSAGDTRGFFATQLRYAVAATSKSCSAIVLSGGAYTDSYDSNMGPYSSATASTPGGDVETDGGVSLSGGGTKINGTVYAAPPPGNTCSPLMVSGGAQATGGATTLPLVFAFPAPTSPTTPTPTSKYTISTPTTLAPGTYGNVVVQKQLTLEAGIYNVNSLVVSGGTRIVLPSQGQVILNIGGNGFTTSSVVNLSGGSQFVNPSGIAANFIITYGGTAPISLSGGSQSAGIVYAPRSSVTLSGSSGWAGAVVACTFNGSGSPLHYDIALHR
jgi:hypothetical protein